jgi:hypothetical protein
MASKVVSFYGYDDCVQLETAAATVIITPHGGGRVLRYSLVGDERNAIHLDDHSTGTTLGLMLHSRMPLVLTPAGLKLAYAPIVHLSGPSLTVVTFLRRTGKWESGATPEGGAKPEGWKWGGAASDGGDPFGPTGGRFDIGPEFQQHRNVCQPNKIVSVCRRWWWFQSYPTPPHPHPNFSAMSAPPPPSTTITSYAGRGSQCIMAWLLDSWAIGSDHRSVWSSFRRHALLERIVWTVAVKATKPKQTTIHLPVMISHAAGLSRPLALSRALSLSLMLSNQNASCCTEG